MQKLKYLFTAYYKDGTSYKQNEEDVSVTDPKRSCFFDVKQDEIIAFVLRGEGHRYWVDLTDGHFEIDRIPFQMHEKPLKDFKLIFFRQHTHTFKVSTMKNKQEEMNHEVVYRMGWQCTVGGQNYQRVMQFK